MNGIPNQLGDDTAGEGFAHILKPALHRGRTTLGCGCLEDECVRR